MEKSRVTVHYTSASRYECAHTPSRYCVNSKQTFFHASDKTTKSGAFRAKCNCINAYTRYDLDGHLAFVVCCSTQLAPQVSKRFRTASSRSQCTALSKFRPYLQHKGILRALTSVKSARYAATCDVCTCEQHRRQYCDALIACRELFVAFNIEKSLRNNSLGD